MVANRDIALARQPIATVRITRAVIVLAVRDRGPARIGGNALLVADPSD